MYRWNYYDVIDNAYPGNFNPRDFQQVPRKFWSGKEGRNRAIEAIKNVIEKELKIPIEEIPLHVDHHFFKKYRLMGPFNIFGQSPFQVIEAVYPGVFKPWQFANVPMNCWKKQVYIEEAMDYFLFRELFFSSYEEAFVKLRKEHFFDFKLTGLFQMAFNCRIGKVREWIEMKIDKINGTNLKPPRINY
jgi:hypothetical protein